MLGRVTAASQCVAAPTACSQVTPGSLLRRADLIQPGYTGGYTQVTGHSEVAGTSSDQYRQTRSCLLTQFHLDEKSAFRRSERARVPSSGATPQVCHYLLVSDAFPNNSVPVRRRVQHGSGGIAVDAQQVQLHRPFPEPISVLSRFLLRSGCICWRGWRPFFTFFSTM